MNIILVKPWSHNCFEFIAAGACPGFCSIKRLGVFVLPLDRMLVHRRSLPRNLSSFPQQFAGTHLYYCVERGTVRVKCLAQEHNTMLPARARTSESSALTMRPKHLPHELDSFKDAIHLRYDWQLATPRLVVRVDIFMMWTMPWCADVEASLFKDIMSCVI